MNECQHRFVMPVKDRGTQVALCGRCAMRHSGKVGRGREAA